MSRRSLFRSETSVYRGPVDYCGWASKQGSKVRTWKKRFFVLVGSELLYFASQGLDDTGVDERGRVHVIGVDYAPDLRHGLHVRGANKSQPLKMRMATALEAQRWFAQLRDAIAREETEKQLQQLTMEPAQKQTSSPRTSTGSAPDPCDRVMEGWLWKEGRRVKNWKRRYMVLRGCVLTYHSNRGFPSLGKETITHVRVNTSKSYSLELTTESKRVLRIAAGSMAEIEPWDRALACALGQPSCLGNDSTDTETTAHSEQEMYNDRMSTGSTKALMREGWLEVKRATRSSEWRQLFCSLRGITFTWKAHPDDLESRGDRVVDVTYADGQRLTMKLDMASGHQLLARAKEHEDLSTWVNVLCDLVQKPRLEVQAAQCYEEPLVLDELESIHHVGRCGWLMKQGLHGKAWKRRYFILHGNTLRYSKAPDEPERGNGEIWSVSRDTARPHILLIQFTSGRLLHVSGHSVDEVDEWLVAMRDVQADKSNQEESDETLENIKGQLKNQRCGWLLKRGTRFGNWQRRFFTLHRNRLSYARSEGERCRGSGIVFDVTHGDERPFCLRVRLQNGRLLCVAADSNDELCAWLEALQAASNTTESFLSQGSNSQERLMHPNQDESSATEAPDEHGHPFEVHQIDNAAGNQSDAENGDWEELLSPGSAGWCAAMENRAEVGEFDSLEELEQSWHSSSESDAAKSSSLSSSSTSSYSSRTSSAQSSAHRPSDLSVTADTRPVCDGWLRKRGERRQNWKRRFFTLLGTKLCYYRHDKGSLLRSYTVAAIAQRSPISNCFAIATTSGRQLLVSAESGDEYDRWLAKLDAAIALSNSDPFTSASDSLPPTAPTEHERPSSDKNEKKELEGMATRSSYKSGWLLKEGQRFKTWKQRYFTYRNGALMYCNDEGGAALGHGLVSHVAIDADKLWTLQITLQSGRIMRVSAESEADMNEWLRCLGGPSSPPATENQSAKEGEEEEGNGGGGGQAAAMTAVPPTPANRLDSSDYFANDTVGHDTLLYLRAGLHVTSSIESLPENEYEFKGEWSMDTPTAAADAGAKAHDVTETTSNGGDVDAVATPVDAAHKESDEELMYHRHLRDSGHVEAGETLRAAQDEDEGILVPIAPCACCIIS